MASKNPPRDWGTPAGRVAWLLEHRHGGSRSAMAKATGVSLTGLIKVVTGQQTPGRRLMEKIVQNTDVSPAWLFAGEGQPLKGAALPVVAACLPGPPGGHEGLFTGEAVAGVADLYAPSRYLLKLGAAEPAVKGPGTRLLAGDLMLMETEQDTFPPDEQLDERWAVVRLPGRGGPVVRLGELTYRPGSDEDGPACLEADTFAYPRATMRRIVLDESPNGEFEVRSRIVRRETPTEGGVGGPSRDQWAMSRSSRQVARQDVVALCLLLVRRYG